MKLKGLFGFQKLLPGRVCDRCCFSLETQTEIRKTRRLFVSRTHIDANLSRFRNCENVKIKKGIAACIKSRSQISRARPSRAE
jgi:hypothetical protein